MIKSDAADVGYGGTLAALAEDVAPVFCDGQGF